ncbi:sulfite exporter TauE/SafE family protein [Methylotenera sp. L2L1]|uniref:sulfite exporter TauE/SafE family protein n=1 Tax=Methylotenera sp. L2L1 TaxID=1502770 RepID=UPI00055AB50A|nr:sulfite exporter TauE/SafE family protein [Methylotenera sp. L2L1]
MIYLITFIAALVAFSISLICGGGAGLLLIPILGFALPVTQVPAALSVGTSISSITKIGLFYKSIRWSLVKHFLPTAIPGVFIGGYLLSHLDPVYIEFCMALFLVSNLPYVFKKPTETLNKTDKLTWSFPAVGFLAGLISGLTGAVGVLFNGVYLRYGLEKEEIVATRAANEIILHLIKLCLYAWLGLFTSKALLLGLTVALAAVISTFMMKTILPKITTKLFSKIGYGAMVVAGVLMLNSASIRIQEAHDPSINIMRMSKGFDAAFTWNDWLYTIEFKYEEGFEFEKLIPFTDLTPTRQAFVISQQADAHKTVIEKVYSLRKISYEAYYYNDQDSLIKKIKFN